MKNRTLGSVFIVAGTTIGAGMLAMPLAAAGVGFSVTLILLIGLWALMCYTALLLLEVYQHVPADTGLGTLAKRYLGRYGQWLTGFSMMFLMYALTAAYISGAGGVGLQHQRLDRYFNVGNRWRAVVHFCCRWRGLCRNFAGRFI